MPVIGYGNRDTGTIDVILEKDTWVVNVHSNHLLVPVDCDTDVFGVTSTGERDARIKSWEAFFVWDDNEWIRADHWDDLSDNQKYVLARWYYDNWSDPIYATTDYLPWVGTNIHGLIVLENL